MLRFTSLLSVLISLGLFTVLLADNSTEFKVRERRNPRGYGLRPAEIPGYYKYLPTSNPHGHIDPHCRICGVSATSTLRRVINGLPVSPRYKYPWIMPMAIRGDEKNLNCAGALISKRFVLTAAHCVRNPEFSYEKSNECKTRDQTVVSCFLSPEKLLVSFMGESHTKPLGSTVCRKIHVHPQYHHRRNLNDIALLELLRPVPQCNKYISPICLPQVPMSKMNGEVIIAGWGRFRERKRKIGIQIAVSVVEGPQRLREGRVYEVDPVHCQMENNVEIRREKIYCTKGESWYNQTSCKGDSGSSVFASFYGVFYSLGVSSIHTNPNTCPISGAVSFASTYGYRHFIRRIAGELPAPPRIQID